LMSATLLTLAPPVVVVLVAQRWFIKGLIDSGK
jgi:sn-glycerol 3-phosphate transport system permease protein